MHGARIWAQNEVTNTLLVYITANLRHIYVYMKQQYIYIHTHNRTYILHWTIYLTYTHICLFTTGYESFCLFFFLRYYFVNKIYMTSLLVYYVQKYFAFHDEISEIF